MAKTRVHELAKLYNVESKFVLEKLKEMGEFVKSPSSTIELPVEMRFKKEYGDQLKTVAETSAPAAPAPRDRATTRSLPARAWAGAPRRVPAPRPQVATPSPTDSVRPGRRPRAARACRVPTRR